MNDNGVTVMTLNTDWVSLKGFASMMQWTERKVQSKISRDWVENVQYKYDPDGEIHISLKGYQAWVESGQGSKRAKKASKSGSIGEVSEFGKPSNGHQSQPTKSAPVSFASELRL